MATKQADDFLATLKALGDSDLASALAADPDLIKKAQKAILEAKRIEADASKQRRELAAANSGLSFDAKAWAKAKRLVTGPYNEGNAAEFKAAMGRTDPNITPDGEASLLAIAMDYHADRSSVALVWPLLVFQAGAKTGAKEIASLCRLCERQTLGRMGDNGRTLMHEVFCQDLDWAAIEAAMAADKALTLGSPQDGGALIEFLRRQAFNSTEMKHPKAWKALETLARSGSAPLSAEVDKNSHRGSMHWESLATIRTLNDEAGQAKAAAFEAFIGLGWCDKGVTPLTDGLSVHGSSAGGPIVNCGSRSALPRLPIEQASLDIFAMLCEREAQVGFSRYDAVGRSRLYFVNERMRQNRVDDPAQQKIFAALAEKCLELGDPPESVNAQNPVAKAANKSMADLIGAAVEKREIRGALGSKGDSPRAPSRSL